MIFGKLLEIGVRRKTWCGISYKTSSNNLRNFSNKGDLVYDPLWVQEQQLLQ